MDSLCSFSLSASIPRLTNPALPETIHQRPVCAVLWRFLDADDDEVTARGLWNDVRSCKMAFLPAVWFLRQFSVRIINVNGHFCTVDFCSKPSPIFVCFE